jgi:hypothetical protein
MRRHLLLLTLFCASVAGLATAQINVKPFPKEALSAKTVPIVKRWGRFTVVDDADAADIVLTFDKKNEHEGTSTQKTGEDGKPDTNYSVTFSSSIHMKATVKGVDAPSIRPPQAIRKRRRAASALRTCSVRSYSRGKRSSELC